MPMTGGLTKAQEEAQKYVDEYGLDRLITKMMNGIIADKPEDPKLYMVKWLSDRLTKEQLEEAGMEISRKAAAKQPVGRNRSPSPARR
mmetsp:Transcript_141233/g.451419  ORF Transcript_141233/g.451419 Transcript_141233/m.451419 type:complete len:88 (-) Transcript_141233:116-379(-)|eukprot:CAMPEP_0177189906 /NCGR_PEP_ID=MMETSP0367-20130122/20526_1 /TAXON_ID=447022 ORGANISM="Scrippsiella hangoei-like, Strain SHHI-4" /NCGR_SAMPLE_ID=MMETSP0367 /ASSEMBLY_ACC=CAM_ASM_000362 /LENGTH=87 /DNA_ID=CAMNT_0018637491 /DNA_START=92 /DNA_END=355 /DNA_ORIENTATION=-